MDQRLRAMEKRCRSRGGDCPCPVGSCQAREELERRLSAVLHKLSIAQASRDSLINRIRRITTPPAGLREDFSFDPQKTPVMVFDGEEGHFGYEGDDGEFIDVDEWPFDQEFVWADDCERLGIRVEVAWW